MAFPIAEVTTYEHIEAHVARLYSGDVYSDVMATATIIYGAVVTVWFLVCMVHLAWSYIDEGEGLIDVNGCAYNHTELPVVRKLAYNLSFGAFCPRGWDEVWFYFIGWPAVLCAGSTAITIAIIATWPVSWWLLVILVLVVLAKYCRKALKHSRDKKKHVSNGIDLEQQVAELTRTVEILRNDGRE